MNLKTFAKTLLAGAALAASVLPAAAIDRIGWSKSRETMYIHGSFREGDADRIVAAIVQNNRKLRGIFLNSPGGSVMEGFKLVVLTKMLDYDTGVIRGGKCMSACFMVLAAGKNRYAHADSDIGIHSVSTYNLQTQERTEDPMAAFDTVRMARLYQYLGVPAYLIGTMVITPPSEMYRLNAQDLQWMNIQVLQ